MDSKLSSVIERVQKLLALSKSSSSASEAANAAGAANRLIDQYRLSEADLGSDDSVSDPMVEDPDYVYQTGRQIPWKSTLLHVLTKHYGVAYFNDRHYPEGRKVSRFKLIGRTSDIQIVKYMFAWLTLECQRLADLNVKGQGRVTVFSYCEGFVHGIAIQLQSSRKEAQQAASSQAIIKLDARLAESEVFMYANHKDLKRSKAQSKVRRDADAYAAGKQKGQSLHLGQALSGSKVKMLKS